jgi:hypothetical protein
VRREGFGADPRQGRLVAAGVAGVDREQAAEQRGDALGRGRRHGYFF